MGTARVKTGNHILVSMPTPASRGFAGRVFKRWPTKAPRSLPRLPTTSELACCTATNTLARPSRRGDFIVGVVLLNILTIRFATLPSIAEPAITLQFSEDDLLRELSAATVDKGELLWLDDRVRQVEVTAGGTRISGNVFGSRPRPYSQTIMLASNGRAITIKGYCSCPLGVNCKHVAAVLLQHLELQLQGTDNASLVTATAPESFDPFSAATAPHRSPHRAGNRATPDRQPGRGEACRGRT
jgi:hypothetical protein